MIFTQRDRQDKLLRALARFLTADQAAKSIHLEMGQPHAKEWAELRSASPVRGYCNEDEAFAKLRELFT